MNPSELIDKYIADLTDWRGEMLFNLRKIVRDADPEITEEWSIWAAQCGITTDKSFWATLTRTR